MFCPKCGAQNSDNAIQCVSCGAVLTPEVQEQNTNDFEVKSKPQENYNYSNQIPNNQGAPVPEVKNNQVFSIVVLVFSVFSCCFSNPVSLILSIIAVVFSSGVNTKLLAGDIQGAQSSAKTAKILTWISLGVMIAALIIWIIIVVVIGISAIPYSNTSF